MAAAPTQPPLLVAVDDPSAPDVAALVERHLAFARRHSPPCDVHALDTARLAGEKVTFFSARSGGRLVAIGALQELGDREGELKSMHTAAEARRSGAGTAVLEALLAEARRRRYRRVLLETGTQPVFSPARALYRRAGFRVCGPFADYRSSPYSTFLALELDLGDGPACGRTPPP